MINSPLAFVVLIAMMLLSAFSYVDYAVSALLMIAITVFVMHPILAQGSVRRYSLTAVMLLYLLWLFIVTFTSAVPYASRTTQVMLIGLPLMYLLSTNYIDFPKAWKSIQAILFITAVALSGLAIWQVIHHIGRGYATGPLNDRNAFAAALNLLWFPIVFLFFKFALGNQIWKSIIVGLGMFTVSVALFATTSRGGILTWSLLLPILLWAGYQYTKSKRTVLVVLTISMFAYLSSSIFLDSSVANRTFAFSQDASTNARLELWQSTIQMTLDHPVLGTGWGTFAYFYPAHRLFTENSTAGFFAHNDYLQFAAEGGVFALAILCMLLIGIFWQLKKYTFQVKQNKQQEFECVALILGVLALFVHASINFIFYFAFMSIVAGLYLARVAHLCEVPLVVKIPQLGGIRYSVKRFFAGFILFCLTMPFVIHICTQICLSGSKVGLKTINIVAPSVTAYDVANFIVAIYPQEGLAQEYLFRTYEYYLVGDGELVNQTAGTAMLMEAVTSFDEMRARNANFPNVGTREVKLLIQNRDIYDAATKVKGAALRKAYDTLNESLKMDPYHGSSMVMEARILAIEGNKQAALQLLKQSHAKVLTRRDQQLISVEYLRQQALPNTYPELDAIEQQLLLIQIDAETGRADIELTNIYEKIQQALNRIEQDITRLGS